MVDFPKLKSYPYKKKYNGIFSILVNAMQEAEREFSHKKWHV